MRGGQDSSDDLVLLSSGNRPWAQCSSFHARDTDSHTCCLGTWDSGVERQKGGERRGWRARKTWPLPALPLSIRKEKILRRPGTQLTQQNKWRLNHMRDLVMIQWKVTGLGSGRSEFGDQLCHWWLCDVTQVPSTDRSFAFSVCSTYQDYLVDDPVESIL